MPKDSPKARIRRARSVHRLLVDPGGSSPRRPLAAAHGTVTLSAPTSLPSTTLGEVLAGRRSRYRFGPMDRDRLSTLLGWALGPGRTTVPPSGPPRTLRLNPSAGGLESLDVHLVVLRRIGDIAVGTYVFEPSAHVLQRTGTGPCVEALESCLVQPQFAARASVFVVLAGRLDKTLVKYTERHYRTLHVDAGIAAQNLYLVSTALELAGCAVSGFYDDHIANLLGLRDDSVPLLAFALGGCGEVGEQR
ncbi:MAG: SagB family peptide dehydrogenase [Rhodococcus sp. (in: high G+C Gram-positive bacteria)]